MVASLFAVEAMMWLDSLGARLLYADDSLANISSEITERKGLSLDLMGMA